MVNRTRTRIVDSFGAGWSERKITTNPVIHTDHLQNSIGDAKYYESTQDVIGLPLVDHALTINQYDNRGFLPLTGRIDQGGGSYIQYENYLPSGFTLVSHVSVPLPTIGESALTLRARSNPSREEVSIPNFLYELKDLPRMIRQMKNLGPLFKNLGRRGNSDAVKSAISSNYLGFEFGWKPLLSDIAQLLQFQSQVDRRILELNRLYSGTGLKRRLDLALESATSTTSIVADSSLGAFITVRKHRVTRVHRWGTIRWRPTVVPKDIGHQALGRQARRLVHGIDHLGVDAVQAWNAIPFSWLADWFGNFGEFLEAHRNDVPAAPTGPSNIMTRTETYEFWERTDLLLPQIKGASGMRILRTKTRAQSSGTLAAHLPLATGRQFSILAALNLQRRKR